MVARRLLALVGAVAWVAACHGDGMDRNTPKLPTSPGTSAGVVNPTIPTPSGIYVLNNADDERPAATGYSAGLDTAGGYVRDVTGHAIFVPIAKMLPAVSTWDQFDWTWGYVDTLVQAALSHQKKFSIELETGAQRGSTYLQSLPPGFAAACGPTCAPLFDVWTVGGGSDKCLSAYVLLPWVPQVQDFWSRAATALAAHLRATGAYSSLTLVHVPGLSVYDEELRLPTGFPRPDSTDTSLCPDGRLADSAVVADADTARWRSLGYSDSAVVAGFGAIAASFAHAFPDRFLGLSLFPAGPRGIDFPNLTGDAVGYLASQIVETVSLIAPGRVQVQADNLDTQVALPEVLNLAAQFGDSVGWQSNKHGGTGAGCDGLGAGSCGPDGPDSPYFRLLQEGSQNRGEYVEVWSADVVAFPQSLDAALAAGFYPPLGILVPLGAAHAVPAARPKGGVRQAAHASRMGRGDPPAGLVL